jgi:hypothetical protein
LSLNHEGRGDRSGRETPQPPSRFISPPFPWEPQNPAKIYEHSAFRLQYEEVDVTLRCLHLTMSIYTPLNEFCTSSCVPEHSIVTEKHKMGRGYAICA